MGRTWCHVHTGRPRLLCRRRRRHHQRSAGFDKRRRHTELVKCACPGDGRSSHTVFRDEVRLWGVWDYPVLVFQHGWSVTEGQYALCDGLSQPPRRSHAQLRLQQLDPGQRVSDAGPNGRNNLDPNAPGAIAGLDPREATTWSSNGGASWTWGRQVGHYFGSATGDEGTRLPHYAWQSSATAKPQVSNQPYTAYMTSCTPCTLNNAAVPRRTTLTEAGGYAPVGKSVGVVTVRNMRTGQTGHTASLGEGIRKGPLGTAVHSRGRRQLPDHSHRHGLQDGGRRLESQHSRTGLRRLPIHHRRARRRSRPAICPAAPLLREHHNASAAASASG